MAKTGLLRKAFGWLLDRGAEKVYQDDVADTAWQKIKAVLPAIFGSGAVTSLLAWFTQNWVPAISGGVLGFVLLIYTTALIRVLRIRRAEAAAVIGVGHASSAPSTASGQGFVSEPQPVKIMTTRGSVGVRAIGILNSISLQFFEAGDTVKKFACQLWIDFYGFTPGFASPTRLLLMYKNKKTRHLVVLSELVAPSGEQRRCPGSICYSGEGSWNELIGAARTTMDIEPTRPGHSPWAYHPPDDTLYCELEIFVPEGRDGDDHLASDVKLEFELSGRGSAWIRARINPWKSFEDPKPSITVL